MSLIPAADLIEKIGGTLLDHFFPDPAKRAEAQKELLELQQKGDLAKLSADVQAMQAQADINKIEAGSADKFTSRWRPFIGWVCGGALAYALVFSPMVAGFAALAGHPVVMPVLNVELLTTLLLSLLGLGGMRTIEKLNNVQGNH